MPIGSSKQKNGIFYYTGWSIFILLISYVNHNRYEVVENVIKITHLGVSKTFVKKSTGLSDLFHFNFVKDVPPSADSEFNQFYSYHYICYPFLSLCLCFKTSQFNSSVDNLKKIQIFQMYFWSTFLNPCCILLSKKLYVSYTSQKQKTIDSPRKSVCYNGASFTFLKSSVFKVSY